MTSFIRIRSHLGRVRRRLRLVQFAVEFAWFVTAAVVLGVLAALVSSWVEPATVGLVRGTLLGAIALVLLLAVVRTALPWRRFTRDERVARWVEQAVPSLAGGVVTSVELEHSQAGSAFAHGLVQAHADETAAQLQAFPPSHLVPLVRAVRALGAVLAAVTIAVGLTLLFEPLQAGFQLLAHGPRTSVLVVPESARTWDVLVGDIDYTLSYPAYTRESPRSITNSSGDIAALAGTRVHIVTRSLVPAVAAAIAFEDSDVEPDRASTVRLEVGADGVTLTGELTVKSSRRFRFQVTTKDSGLIAETRSRVLEALPDRPPEAEIVEPEADLEVRSTDPVRVTFHLADDYGLGGVDIVTQKLAGLEPPTRRRVAALAGDRSWVGGSDVDLRRFQLDPGETLRVWVEAYDTNTVAEAPGRTKSKEVLIRLYSADEQHAENLDAQRALLDAMVDVLADRLESPITEHIVSRFDSAVDAQSKIVRGSSALIARMDAIESSLADDPIASDSVKDAIVDMRKRHMVVLDVESKQVHDALETVDASERPPLFDQLAATNERGIKELEGDIPWLEKLLEEQDNHRLLQAAKSLVSAEREIRSLLEQLKKSDDAATRMELQKRLKDLLAQLDQMSDTMQRSARPMPMENMNYDALEASDMRGLGEVRSSVEKMMDMVRDGRIDDAIAALDALGQAVQTVASRIEDAAEGLEGGQEAAGAADLRRMATEVDKLAGRQEALRKQIEDLERAARGQVADKMRASLAPEIAKEMQAMSELEAGLSRIDRSQLRDDDRRALESIERTVADARETLSHEDIAQAGRLMSEVREAMDELGRDLESERPGPTAPSAPPRAAPEAPAAPEIGRGGGGADDALEDAPESAENPGRPSGDSAREAARSLSKLRPVAREREKNLDKLTPLPSDLLDRPTRDALEELSKQQADNAERVQRLVGDLDKLEAERPGTKGAVGPALQQAKRSMEDASNRLGTELQPGRGHASASEALDHLDDAREAIGRELGQEREGTGGAGRASSRAQVEIPDAERYSVPKEFREELLKSLRESAPTSYRSLVERYYEALVQ